MVNHLDHRPSVNASLYSRLLASESALPEVYTTAEPPYIITFANSAWEKLCGWKLEFAVGRTCAILQGERTCKRTICQVSWLKPQPQSRSRSPCAL